MLSGRLRLTCRSRHLLPLVALRWVQLLSLVYVRVRLLHSLTYSGRIGSCQREVHPYFCSLCCVAFVPV